MEYKSSAKGSVVLHALLIAPISSFIYESVKRISCRLRYESEIDSQLANCCNDPYDELKISGMNLVFSQRFCCFETCCFSVI